MELAQIEVCFVCDEQVCNSETILGGKTCFSKTDLPAKISQLIGNAFVVVVSEDDKLCTRCATLINKSDRLEMDLLKIKQILIKLLSIKYNLDDEEDADFSLLQELDQLRDEGNTSDISNIGDEKVSRSENSSPTPSFDGKTRTVDLQSAIHSKGNSIVKVEMEPLSCNYSNEYSKKCESTDTKDIKPKLHIKYQNESEKHVSKVSNKSRVHQENSGESNQSKELIVLSEVKSEKHVLNYYSKSKSLCSQRLNSGRNTSRTRNPSSSTKYEVEEVFSIPLKKLRPILPKITSFTDIAALCRQEMNSQKTQARGSSNSLVRKTEVKNIDSNLLEDCDILNKVIVADNKEELKESKNSLGEDKITSYTCKYCTRNLESEEMLQKHLNQHYSRDVFKCKICDKVFKSEALLKEHKRVHKEKPSYCCDFCGKEFKVRHVLEEHRRSHTKEVPYICDVCGKKFSFQSTYWLHRKWHDNPFPYKCDDCGRLFRHSSVLAVHRRKHSGERPYKCSYCSFTFTVNSALKRHLILHTKEYPFRCDLCNRGFTVRFKFIDHLARVHKVIVEKPVKGEYKMAVHDVVDNVPPVDESVIEESIVESHEYVIDGESSIQIDLDGESGTGEDGEIIGELCIPSQVSEHNILM